MDIALLPILAPLALALAAARPLLASGPTAPGYARLTEAAALAALAVAGVSALALILAGPGSAALVAGLGARLDVVSVTMLLLVAFIGWVVLRYSASALRGEAGQVRFHALMCLTLAMVMLLVVSGSLVQMALGWVGMGLGLQRLLLFYADRPRARRAARKKALFARAGDAALLAGLALLGAGYGSADIATILAAAAAGVSPAALPWAVALIVLAAMLKSAQFPAHGWLTQVMETPTPVSALLHAGLVNAGGFLLIRLADVLLLAPWAMAALVVVGGFTALFASLTMLTQPAVKTALAWSTIAQMGFMLLQCGLGLFALALLHLVAHSLYKAHAFLSAGGAVAAVAAARRPGPVAVPGRGAVALAMGSALAIYAGVGLAFGLADKAPQAVALGAMLVLGVAYLLAQGLAGAAPLALTLRTGLSAGAAAVGYFAFQAASVWLTAGTLPRPPAPGPLEWALMALAVTSFAAVALAQATLPLWAGRPAAQRLRVHLANGLYADALVDRALGGWSARSPS